MDSFVVLQDEQIFMLRSKLQEMGVDTDSLSMVSPVGDLTLKKYNEKT